MAETFTDNYLALHAHIFVSLIQVQLLIFFPRKERETLSDSAGLTLCHLINSQRKLQQRKEAAVPVFWAIFFLPVKVWCRKSNFSQICVFVCIRKRRVDYCTVKCQVAFRYASVVHICPHRGSPDNMNPQPFSHLILERKQPVKEQDSWGRSLSQWHL